MLRDAREEEAGVVCRGRRVEKRKNSGAIFRVCTVVCIVVGEITTYFVAYISVLRFSGK